MVCDRPPVIICSTRRAAAVATVLLPADSPLASIDGQQQELCYTNGSTARCSCLRATYRWSHAGALDPWRQTDGHLMGPGEGTTPQPASTYPQHPGTRKQIVIQWAVLDVMQHMPCQPKAVPYQHQHSSRMCRWLLCVVKRPQPPQGGKRAVLTSCLVLLCTASADCAAV